MAKCHLFILAKRVAQLELELGIAEPADENLELGLGKDGGRRSEAAKNSASTGRAQADFDVRAGSADGASDRTCHPCSVGALSSFPRGRAPCGAALLI